MTFIDHSYIITSTMELKHFLKDKNRKQFADTIGIELSYLHNLCQHPEQAGKNTILKIIKASDGAVTFEDMTQTKGR